MKYTDLVKEINNEVEGINKEQAKKVLDIFVNKLANLPIGEEINIIGFGKFTSKEIEVRASFEDPTAKKKIRTLTFKPSKKLKG